MRIQHNIMAMNSYRNYNNNVNSLSSNLEKLSSGYRINRAGDDAAGLAISEKMRAQITGLDAAQKNVKDGISLVKTAEGALQEVQDMMNRMVYLATQSANGTYDNDIDRANLQAEVDSLLEEIDRIADSANFNGQELLDGSLGGPEVKVVQLGAAAVTTQVQTQTAGGTTVTNTVTVSAAKQAEVTLDFANKTADALMGGSIEVDGKTYKFMDATAAADYTAGANEVVVTLTASMNDAAIADKFQGAFTGTEFSEGATVSGTVVTLKGNADGSDGQTAEDVAVEMADMGLKLQIGDSSDSFNQLMISVQDMHSGSLGIGQLKIDTLANAQAAIDKIKTAINTVSSQRGDLGAIQNRLEHTMNNLSVMEENITDAESTIRDTDVADEMMAYTKNNILIQSAQAMLAQANAVPQGVLQLLQ